jgi:hypothetical protein
LVAQDEKECVELGALGGGETRKQLVFGVALCSRGAIELLFGTGTRRTPSVSSQATYDLAQAPDALTALADTHTQGKLGIGIG